MEQIVTSEALLFDETALNCALSELPRWQVCAFACSCADRIMRDVRGIERFSEQFGLIYRGHKAVWRAARAKVDEDNRRLENQLLTIIPLEGDDDTFEGALLDDACAAMIYAIRAIRMNRAQNATWSARRSYETADRYVARLMNETEYSRAMEAQITSHWIVQRELIRQKRDLQFLLQSTDDSERQIESLMRVGEDESVLALSEGGLMR